jgi:hypothetical protein
MAETARPDTTDANVSDVVCKDSPLPLGTVNRSKKGSKTDNPYGDDNYSKGTSDVLKRLGAGKKYVPAR